MDKYAPDDIPNINSTCFKLNSLQLQALLRSYHCAPDEPFIPAVGARDARRGRTGRCARGSLRPSQSLTHASCTVVFAVDECPRFIARLADSAAL